MINEMQSGLIALIRSALSGQAEILPQGFDLASIVPLIRRHHISVIAFCGAVNCGISPASPAVETLLSDVGVHFSICEGQQNELKALTEAFEQEGIDYILLKGAVIKPMYPRSEMRAMSDADILIRTEQQEEASKVMEKLGYQKGVESDHELHWDKPALHVELHKRLMPSYDTLYCKYFSDVWNSVKPVAEGKHCYQMNPDDFFLYLFTHFAKHYRDGGIGLLQLCDLQIYRDKNSLDEELLLKELKKLHLDVFYRNVLETLDAIFNEKEQTEITATILETVCDSGAYGRQEKKQLSWATRNSKKSDDAKKIKHRMVLEMIFLPFWRMRIKYPILNKLPFLLPIMWVVRWVEALLFRTKNVKQQAKQMRKMTTEEILEHQGKLNFVGLEFELGE
ncbi:MAG: nucleotidyltransferase family protein [Oscillospiraceae bacterium]|nr:nucleotidyltransferase family protein [Oscillospiraceae bacterium]